MEMIRQLNEEEKTINNDEIESDSLNQRVSELSHEDDQLFGRDSKAKKSSKSGHTSKRSSPKQSSYEKKS